MRTYVPSPEITRSTIRIVGILLSRPFEGKRVPTKEVPLNGDVLAWAREESGLSRDELASKVKVGEADIASWEDGETLPTKGQFTRLVNALKRPSALFFLPNRPTRGAVPTSFRRAPGLGNHQLNASEVRQIRWARRLQDLVSWVLRDRENDEISLRKFQTERPPDEAASYFRSLVNIPPAEQLEWDNPREGFRAWRAALEEFGIIVLQLSLGKEGIRGFSAWDKYAPLVAVNTAYHPTARIFTLFHEVGHLLTRTDAACLRFILPSDPELGAERWCERFSADFLMPEEALRQVAARFGLDGRTSPDFETARRLARRLKVSTRALSLRLQELGLAPAWFYASVERQLADLDWNPRGGGGGGQPRPEKRLGQLGTRIPEVLLQAGYTGRLNRLDLADYLNLTTGQVEELGSLVKAGD